MYFRENNNKRLGRIIYANSSTKKPRNFSAYKSQPNFSIKAYDRLIQKTRKTLDECRKQLNDNSYFNNNEFYDQHKKAQLIKFNKGLSEYRYNTNPLMTSQESNELNRNITSYNFHNMNRNLYNHLLNSRETEIQNNENINEINNLRKMNLSNEKIISEKDKQILDLVNKIKELDKIINDERNKMKKITYLNRNNILKENNFKEEKNKNEQNIKKLNGEIKEYLNIIEEQNKKIELMQKDYDKIKQENVQFKLNQKSKNLNDKISNDFSKLSREYNDSCRLNEILKKKIII